MTYVTADVHGMAGAFDALLEKICPGSGDVLYILGDAVDRGPDGIGILSRCLSMPGIRMLKGNHEMMLYRAYRGPCRNKWHDIWLSNGGAPTERAFLKLPKRERERILDAVEAMPDHIETEAGGQRYGLVHAYWSPDPEERLWKRPSPWLPMRGVPEGMRVVTGHTPVPFLQADPASYLSRCGERVGIYKGRYFTCVDCGCGLEGHAYRKCCLGCLRLDDGAEFYSAP